MIPLINLVIMILTALASGYFYVRSAGPASLEKKIGPAAYDKCFQYRVICSIFMTISLAGYVVYYFYPLKINFPRYFPWGYHISLLIAIIIAVPSGYLLFRGVRDAGEESIRPRKEHKLYGGIYRRIRHPQSLGELPFAWVFAFLLNSPFLVLFSILWVPIFYLMCVAEEKDLEIRYGEKYIEYKRNTGFIIPKKTKLY
jgi:protein-S-isoprenylcysteine O-methyltransferase Ste14